MTESKSLFKAMTVLGLLLAIGMTSAAFILGVQAKGAVSGQTITVKGLAETPVKADSAEWTINIGVTAHTQIAALRSLVRERKVVEKFLKEQALPVETWTVDVETLEPHYVDEYIKERYRRVQRGYNARQVIRVLTSDLAKITDANKAFLQLKAENHPVTAQPPRYLVGSLEEVKMSLIADATKNARTRATEFVRQDGAKVGVMKSARQGAFYILPATGYSGDYGYGGVYDKSTIDKLARVVVTIVYNIE